VKEQFLAGHLLIVDHQAVIGFVELGY